ncbi:MAG: SH3 domain-containing protein [Clostridia bacterium]|nr:SH3 domain-containing protein [Clostridia bacterium]
MTARTRRPVLLALALCMALLPCMDAQASSGDDFFTDAVFFGDSLTVGLEKYVSAKRESDEDFWSNAQFLAQNGYMVSHMENEDGFSKHPSYDGKQRQPQKSLDAMGAKKVFITLGINDSAGEVSLLLSNYQNMLAIIRDRLPEAQLYIIAVFPMTPTRENTARNNKKIDQINEGLLRLAMSSDIPFIDFTPRLKDQGGALQRNYSSDDYVHFSNEGYDVWIDAMYDFVKFISRTPQSSGQASIVNVKEFVNARSKPSKSGKKVSTIAKGETVDVLEASSGGWYKVAYDGEEMYVYGEYLSIGTAGLRGKVVNVSEYANLRKRPNTEAEQVGQAEKDAILSVSQLYFNPSWYRVIVNGDPAYISKEYVELS